MVKIDVKVKVKFVILEILSMDFFFISKLERRELIFGVKKFVYLMIMKFFEMVYKS